MPNSQPQVITKPENSFQHLPKFFILGIIFLSFVLGSFFIYYKITRQPTVPQSPLPPKVAAQPIKPLRSLVGTIEAVDTKKSTLLVSNSHGEKQSFPVSADVLISQIVLGASHEDGKQISLPTNLLNMEDLKKKNGTEVYLVFDSSGKNVIQIQMYEK